VLAGRWLVVAGACVLFDRPADVNATRHTRQMATDAKHVGYGQKKREREAVRRVTRAERRLLSPWFACPKCLRVYVASAFVVTLFLRQRVRVTCRERLLSCCQCASIA